MFLYDRVNRITSRDYNPIFDTDFASLVRYDRFPSLLYGSGTTFTKIDYFSRKRHKISASWVTPQSPGLGTFLFLVCVHCVEQRSNNGQLEESSLSNDGRLSPSYSSSDTDMIGNEGWDISYIYTSLWDTGGNCLCVHSLFRRDISC